MDMLQLGNQCGMFEFVSIIKNINEVFFTSSEEVFSLYVELISDQVQANYKD